MMRKKLPPSRPNRAGRALVLPLLALCCAGVLWIQGRVYYGGELALSHRLAGLQLPILYGLPYAPPPTPAPTPSVGTDIAEGVSEGIRVELLTITQSPMVNLAGTEPKVLIYHTHTTEAYFQTPAHSYTPSGDWRTHENDHNIVAVGEKLATLLRETYGIAVIHDTTDHEPPKLATSYSRSVKTMEKYKRDYPSITMFIDVHRDAYGSNIKEPKDFIVIDGKEVARIMFVVGTGEGATGTGYGEMPDFAANFALAKRITESLAGVNPGLVRNIRVKTGRYNQHISNQCLLIEVGHNANTLEQALNAVDYLAAAIAECAGLGDGAISTTPAPDTSLFAP
ncbi:MAG: hypothetical protein EOM66_06740 [Clostridia bacterium]|nr:hypothetical protein [Clostridia bacterium]